MILSMMGSGAEELASFLLLLYNILTKSIRPQSDTFGQRICQTLASLFWRLSYARIFFSNEMQQFMFSSQEYLEETRYNK